MKIMVVLIMIIAFVTLIFYLLRHGQSTQKPLAITGSIPAENASGVSVFDPITITFNQAVDSSNITVTSLPSENWSISQEAPNLIKIDHQLYLHVATAYKLTILQNNSILGTLAFETAHEQNDPRDYQITQAILKKNYPLASLIPYQTPDYRVIYSAPLTLEIDITSSMSSEVAISQVKSWVQSNGIDPSTHKYNTVIKSSTP